MARDTLADAKQGYAAEGEPPLPGVTRPDAALAARLAERLAEKGLAYRPRTHHLVGTAPKFTNRLILETSPYLLQHAHNPVNWRPWGEAAFLRAEEEGKPVLMSVGYATCHWCHVMERESFEDLTIAEFINQHFIAIKVDREERPDIDDIYMRAVYLLTGHGGWPMTVVLTPAREPFFAGTYFPPFDGARGASQGFLTILRFLSRAYSESRDDLVAQAQALSQRIAMLSAPARPGALPGAGCIGDAADQYAAAFDVRFGGFGRAPKFPQPARLDLLLRHYRRTGDEQSRAMVVTSLDRMARGGMHDHVGGGFHRYSVDAEWLVPHFEKMLYDNAQLAVIYLEGYQVTGRADFRRVAARILDYVAREMTSPEGAFYSATDADSPTPAGHEEEGWFFTWTPSEIVEVLGEDRGRRLVALFGVTEGGNFEGRNILHLPRPFTDLAPAHGVSERALQEAVDQDLSALRAARQLRPPPLRDDKILTAWNGLMISAFSRGALILNEPRYQDMADRAARFLLTHLRSSDGAARGRLVRSYRNGQTRHRAVLEDYAFLIRGLLDLHEVAGERAFLEEALALQTIQDADHGDATEGGYFMTAHHAEPLIARDKPDSDGAVPSGNSVAAENLLRLAALTGQDAFRRRAELLMSAFAETLSRGGAPAMLCALERYFDVTREVVLLAGPGEEALNEVIRETYLPNRALLRLSEDSAHAQRALVPLLEGKVRLEGNATAYVCERGRCELPTRDPQTLRRQLRATRPLT